MGQTTKYALPWPSPVGFVRDGAATIRALAEAVESALLPPVLACTASDEPDWGADKTGRVAWDVEAPGRVRGVWTHYGSVPRLIKPPSPGWYLVAADFRFGGKSSADVYNIAIQTKTAGADEATAATWLLNQVEIPANPATFSQLCASALVLVPDTTTGLQVRVQYDAGIPPAAALSSHKLRVHKLSNW